MKAAILLAALLGTRALAAPDPAALLRAALPPGFAPAALDGVPFIPIPVPVMIMGLPQGDMQTVALPALLDRHLATTDSYRGAGGTTLVAGTLDLNGDGYLA